MHTNRHAGEINGEPINDAIYKRDQFLSERYNCTIEYIHETDGCNILKNSVLADDHAYDMLISTVAGTAIGSISTQGVLGDLAAYDVLSLDSAWWSPLFYDSCRIGGKMYFTTGDIAPSIYCSPACIFVNLSLAEDYKIDIQSIYKSVDDGVWTVDAFDAMTRDLYVDLDQNNTIEVANDFFGRFISGAAYYFAAGAGVNLSSIDKNGELVCELDNEHSVNVIEKLSTMLTRYSIPAVGDTSADHIAFKTDRILAISHFVSSAYTRYRDMENDFTILPMPKYDENQEQ